MILTPEKGGYVYGEVVRMYGSFQINGTSTPDVIRDGKSTLIKSVGRDSAGVFTVTLADGIPLPKLLISERADHHPSATPTKFCTAHTVVGSYSQSNRSFKIVCQKMGSAPAVDDPDDNTRISFELIGSLLEAVGTDAA